MTYVILALGFVGLAAGLIAYQMFSWGFVATLLVEWFILPLFPDFPTLTWMNYAGISLVISCFIRSFNNENLKDEVKLESHWIVQIVHPWLVLLIAFVFKSFTA